MQHSLECANDLIFKFYEVAQDRSLLPSFMSALAANFGGHIAGLRVHDSGHSALTSRYIESVGLSRQEWQEFDLASAHVNIWRTKGFEDMRAEGVGHDGTIAPRSELIKTSFYKFLQTIDISYGMGICLWMGPDEQAAVLSLNRPGSSGAFGPKDLAFAHHLLPHFRSAYAIMRRVSWLDSKTSSLAAAIDRMHVGLALTNGSGRCSYRNESADDAINRRRGLSLSASGSLRCSGSATQRELDDAVLLAASGQLSAPRRIHVRDLDGKLSCVLVVTMLRGDLVQRPITPDPSVAIFIHTPSTLQKNPESVLQQSLGLTPAEARLAALLASGLELGRCAEMLAVSVTTVRTQLRGLFAKTGTRRQSELVCVLEFALRAE